MKPKNVYLMLCLAGVLIPYSQLVPWILEDRKSTRLNSSHSQISYAVFCLKKKKNMLHAKKLTGVIDIKTTHAVCALARPLLEVDQHHHLRSDGELLSHANMHSTSRHTTTA